MTFKKAFCNAKAFDKSITEHTHIFAVFISGLEKVSLFFSLFFFSLSPIFYIEGETNLLLLRSRSKLRL